MKKPLILLGLALACASATPALCAIRTASFATTLTVLESCRIDGAPRPGTAPLVSCQMASAALVSAQAGAAGGPAWTVTF